jgi:ABC-type transport system substrate-binding protein
VYLEKAYAASTIGSTNRAAYDNATVNNLLAQVQTTVSGSTRCRLYQQVETQINADAPSISMYTLWAPVAYRTDLITGVTASQVIYPMSLRDIRIK